MTRVTRIALGLLGVGVALGMSTGSASAGYADCEGNPILCSVIVGTGDGGTCNGYTDSNCTYCSYNGSPTASDEYWCNNGYTGYHYQNCTTWIYTVGCVDGRSNS